MHTDSRSSDSSPVSTTGPDRAATPDAGDGPRLDVVAIGNALVDVLASATDADLAALDLVKGTMALVDQ